jgi:hypothetical protein
MPQGTEGTPIDLTLLSRRRLKTNAGLVASGQAIGLHIVAQNRFLTVIALLTKLSVKDFTVEDTALNGSSLLSLGGRAL